MAMIRLFVLVSLFVGFEMAQAETVRDSVQGLVLCARVAPKTETILVMNYGRLDRSYQGRSVVGEMAIEAMFRPVSGRLQLKFVKVDAFGLSLEEISSLDVRAPIGDFVRFSVGQNSFVCNVVP
jgi:hypothetical protein